MNKLSARIFQHKRKRKFGDSLNRPARFLALLFLRSMEPREPIGDALTALPRRIDAMHRVLREPMKAGHSERY